VRNAAPARIPMWCSTWGTTANTDPKAAETALRAATRRSRRVRRGPATLGAFPWSLVTAAWFWLIAHPPDL